MTHEDKKMELEKWFKSEKADEYFSNLKREDDREAIWVEKLIEFTETLDDDEVKSLMLKFVDWENKYQERYYNRGILTYSNIMTLIFECACIHGTSIENDEMFPTESHEFRGFVINLTHGQGSVLWVTYQGERLL